MPDSDHRSSIMGRIIPLWLLCKHRKQTHSIYFSCVCGALMGIVNLQVGLGVMVGMILHIFWDRLTKDGRRNGLPCIWYPYTKESRSVTQEVK